MAWGLRTVLWLALLGAGLGQAGIAGAQSVKKAGAQAQSQNAAPKKDATGAQKSLDTGIKAFEAGKYDQAIGSLSSAITSGGLPSQLMAKALYYRGVSFRKSGKPAQAISDLTSALWLKGGLSDSERALAMENRAGAYREAGLVEPRQVENARTSAAAGRPAAVSEKVAAASASPAPAAPPAQPKAAAAAAPSSATPAASSWQSSTSVREAPAPVTTATVTLATAPATPAQPYVGPQRPTPPPARDPADAFSQHSTAPAQAALRERVATAPSGAEQPAPAPQASTGLSGGFLKGLFGDLSLGGKPPSRPEAAAPAPGPATGNVGNADWSQSTRVVGPGAAAKQAAVAPAPAVAAPPPQPEGNYRLQVAAVRTRQEAEAVSAKLRQQHGKELKSRAVEIDEATLANVGTFYRVRVGPYVEANEPRNLCVKLRQKGYDCLVVSIAQ